jgi:hypothetical protein
MTLQEQHIKEVEVALTGHCPSTADGCHSETSNRYFRSRDYEDSCFIPCTKHLDRYLEEFTEVEV